MKHPHDELIRAWLDGRAVQYLEGDLWVDLPAPDKAGKMPHFYADHAYRLKPETFRVRHALMRADGKSYVLSANSLEVETALSRNSAFVKWLDDWTELQA